MDKEEINGVKIYRAPIICKISKGTVSLEFIRWASVLSRHADVVNLHLPMLEAGILSWVIPKKKLMVTYHCDINLPKGILNQFMISVMDYSHASCMKKVPKILVTTVDYASHSRLLPKYKTKWKEILAPVKPYKQVKIRSHERVAESGKDICIGFCGRIVEEKGLNVKSIPADSAGISS